MAQEISKTLETALAKLEKTRKTKTKETQPEEPKKAEVVQLPLWTDATRGTPNQVLRGALFSSVKPSNIRALKRELIACQKGFEIRFTGWQLTQTDLDVWEQALHLAKQRLLGDKIEFSAHDFLRSINRKTDGRAHKLLENSFIRLTACCVEITDSKEEKTYFGSLVESGARDDKTGRYVLQINPSMIRLFNAGWVEIDAKQRQLLRRKPLAQWLHGFLATHKKPHPMKIETYRDLCGSSTKERLTDFKKRLVKALNDLKVIDYISNFEIKDGLVYVERTANDIQKIHSPDN